MADTTPRRLTKTPKSRPVNTVSCDTPQEPCVASAQTPPGGGANLAAKTRCWMKCCPFRGRHTKVGPSSPGPQKLIEVRPGRFLHIHHMNPRPRDADFAAEIRFSPGLQHWPPGDENRKIQKVDILHGVGDKSDKNEETHGDVSPNAQSHNTSPHKIIRVNQSVQQQVASPQEKSGAKSMHDQAALTADTRTDIHLAEATEYAAVIDKLYTSTTRNADVIFFIHGVGGSANVWKSQIDYFGAAGYEVVAPDLIGHGLSGAPRQTDAYSFREILLDMFMIFDLYCKRRNVVIAHSYGASFAAVLARERYHRISRLVMISGGSPTPLGPQPGIFSMPACLLNCCQPVMLRVFRKNAFHKESKTCIPQERAFDIPSYVLKHTMNGQVWPQGDELYHEGIDVPTLLVHGRDDHLVSVEEEQGMIEVIAGSQMVVLDGASHMVMLERPREVNHIIRNFITTGIPLLSEEGTAWPTDITHCESPDVTYEGVNLTMKHEK